MTFKKPNTKLHLYKWEKVLCNLSGSRNYLKIFWRDWSQTSCLPQIKKFPEFASSPKNPAKLTIELVMSTSKNNPDVQSMMTSTNQTSRTPSEKPMGAASNLFVEDDITNPGNEGDKDEKKTFSSLENVDQLMTPEKNMSSCQNKSNVTCLKCHAKSWKLSNFLSSDIKKCGL